jgi:hypothetical protein
VDFDRMISTFPKKHLQMDVNNQEKLIVLRFVDWQPTVKQEEPTDGTEMTKHKNSDPDHDLDLDHDLDMNFHIDLDRNIYIHIHMDIDHENKSVREIVTSIQHLDIDFQYIQEEL